MGKHIVVAIIFIILGSSATYLYQKSIPATNPETAMGILNSCKTSVDAIQTQSTSCLSAYRELESCGKAGKTCDYNKTAEVLKTLESQRASAESIINQQNNYLEDILKKTTH